MPQSSKLMAAASKTPSGKSAAKAKTDKSDEKKANQPPSPQTSSNSLLIVQILVAFITGAILAGYVAVYFLESEYREFVLST